MMTTGWRKTMGKRLPTNTTALRNICSSGFFPFFFTGRSSSLQHPRGLSSSSGIPADEKSKKLPLTKAGDEQQLAETARRVCETIRRRPRWESTLLSHFPSSHLFHPTCISLVLHPLSSTNPLLSLRYFLWLSSSSPDPHSSSSLLHSLALAKAWRPALLALRSTKCRPDPSALDSFLHHLFKNVHTIDDAFRAFSEITTLFGFSPSLPTWNAALSASLRAGRTDVFWRFYERMMRSSGADAAGDASTAGYLIQALCREDKLIDAYKLLREVSRNGVVPDVVSLTKLVAGFSKIGNFGKVSELLHLMIAGGRPPDIFTYQSIIHGLCNQGMGNESFRIFKDLKLRGYAPDNVTYTTMIDGLCKMGQMDEARKLWLEMVSKEMEPNHYTYNVVIDGYCKSGDIEQAKKVYSEMLARGYRESTVSCNTMISGLCLQGKVSEAMDMFEKMPRKGIEQDVISCNTLIQGLCEDGRTVEAMIFYRRLVAAGMQPSVSTYMPLIVALCNEGNVIEAAELMKSMEARGLEPLACASDCIINGFCKVGKAEDGLAWLVKMLEKNLRPRAETFNRLTEYLSSVGRVDDALLVLNAMFQIGCSLGRSVCYLLVDKLCSGENRFRVGELLEEILLTDA